MEEYSSFFFRNRVTFFIEKTSFGLVAEFGGASSWTKCCGSVCAGLWERMREMGNETTVTLFTDQVLAVIRAGFGVLIICCSAPLSSLRTGCVVTACWWCKKVCFVYIRYGCTALHGKGEGFILCSLSEGFQKGLQKGEGKVRQTDGTPWVVSGCFIPAERGILLAYTIQSCAESTVSWRHLGLLENLLTQ